MSANAYSGSFQKIPSNQAGYMELDGAVKDGGCYIVKVSGGVSTKLGCCNLFNPQSAVKRFSCGTCTHVDKD